MKGEIHILFDAFKNFGEIAEKPHCFIKVRRKHYTDEATVAKF